VKVEIANLVEFLFFSNFRIFQKKWKKHYLFAMLDLFFLELIFNVEMTICMSFFKTQFNNHMDRVADIPS
jgi:hypothetical protein